MKQLLLTSALFFLCCTAVVAQQPAGPLPARTVVEKACQRAAVEKKMVLVIFHASWCGWCRKMEKSLEDPSCRDYFNDSYVVAYLDVDESGDKKALENPGADELRRQWHGDGAGLPYWVVLNDQGDWRGDSRIREEGQGPDKGTNVGCPASAGEVEHFIRVLKETSSITPEQAEAVRQRFRRNE